MARTGCQPRFCWLRLLCCAGHSPAAWSGNCANPELPLTERRRLPRGMGSVVGRNEPAQIFWRRPMKALKILGIVLGALLLLTGAALLAGSALVDKGQA